MNGTHKLHDFGQSLWLDNITRGLLTSGTLRRYIAEFSVTGLTSKPSIFDHAIKNAAFYDDAIREKLAGAGASPQRLLWASTGTKDPGASETLYIEALAGHHQHHA
jgi:transaldolase